MKKLTTKKQLFRVASVFCVSLSAVSFIFQFQSWEYCVVFALMGGVFFSALFYFANKNLRSARLIVENMILHIRPAVLQGRNSRQKDEDGLGENLEMVVSVFGILLGAKIIKWGQEGGRDGRLKAVEIGKDYLSIDYGTLGETHNIRLIYSRPEGETLTQITEKFRRDTGVVPTVIL